MTAPSGRARTSASEVTARSANLVLAAGVAAAVLLVLGAAEGLLRLCEPQRLASRRGLHVFSPTYGWVPRRDISLVIDGRRFTLNARGHRGRELSLPKPAERRRVAVLGDSIAFGLGVSDEQTFAHLLDARPSGLEVANLAVQGYGPGQELLVLEREALRFEPDVVLVALCLSNDLVDAMLAVSLYDGRTPQPRFRLDGSKLVLDAAALQMPPPRRALQWLADHSHLAERLGGLLGRRPGAAATHWHQRYAEALSDEAGVLRLNLAIVRRMSELCRLRGVRFLLAAFPDRAWFRDGTPLVARFLESLRAESIPVVDLADRFRRRGLRLSDVAFDGTGHLNPAGHALTAELLEAEIAALYVASENGVKSVERSK